MSRIPGDFASSILQSYYDREYNQQQQQYGGRIGVYFQAPNYIQRGSGVGSFLSGLARPIIPIAKKTMAQLSPYLSKLLKEVASDFVENPRSLERSMKRRLDDALDDMRGDVIKKFRGAGITTDKRKATLSPPASKSSIKSANKKNKTSVRGNSSKSASKRKQTIKKQTTTVANKKSTEKKYTFFR